MENASRKIKRTLLLKKNKKDNLPTQPKKLNKKDALEVGLRVPHRRLSDDYIEPLASPDDRKEYGEGVAPMSYSLTRSNACELNLPMVVHGDGGDVVEVRDTTDYSSVPAVLFTEQNQNLMYAKSAFDIPSLVSPQNDGRMNRYVDSGYVQQKEILNYSSAQNVGLQHDDVFHQDEAGDSRSQFLDMVDVRGSFCFEAKSVNTALSDFTHTEPSDYTNYEEDDEEVDELEDLDRDVSHWEVRSSGHDGPAIRRRDIPVVISEDHQYDDFLDHWGGGERVNMMSPPNSANIISNWQ